MNKTLFFAICLSLGLWVGSKLEIKTHIFPINPNSSATYRGCAVITYYGTKNRLLYQFPIYHNFEYRYRIYLIKIKL